MFHLDAAPQIIGRPHLLKMLESLIEFMRAHEGVSLATCAEIAEQAAPALSDQKENG